MSLDFDDSVAEGACDRAGGHDALDLSETRLPYRKALIRSGTLQLVGSGEKFGWTAPADGVGGGSTPLRKSWVVM